MHTCVKQRPKSWKNSLMFSLRFIQMSSMKVKYAQIHTLVNMSITFLILCTLFILFSLFVFCFTLTRYRTTPNSQLPPVFHDMSKKLQFIPLCESSYPFSFFQHTQTHDENTCIMWLLLVWATVGMKLPKCVRVVWWVSVCFNESHVKCEVFCYKKKKNNNVMKVALPAVKRIQCSVEAQIQLALWAPWNGDNTGWLCQQASNLS